MDLDPEYADDSTSESILDTAFESGYPEFEKHHSSSGNPDFEKHPLSSENPINGATRTHSSVTNATVFTSSALFHVQSPTGKIPPSQACGGPIDTKQIISIQTLVFSGCNRRKRRKQMLERESRMLIFSCISASMS